MHIKAKRQGRHLNEPLKGNSFENISNISDKEIYQDADGHSEVEVTSQLAMKDGNTILI